MTDSPKTDDRPELLPESEIPSQESKRPLHSSIIEDILYAIENDHYWGFDLVDGPICPKGLTVGKSPDTAPT